MYQRDCFAPASDDWVNQLCSLRNANTMELNPNKLDKYLYIRRTPTWLIRGFYALGILSWLLVAYAFVRIIPYDFFFRWFVGPMVAFFTLYHLVNHGLSLFYKRFDLAAHKERVKKFWQTTTKEPSVDVYLPLCGEDIEVIRNTWHYVTKLGYSNFNVYVLDDSKEDRRVEHEKMAREFGFTYFARPDRGVMKKAGNIRYAFERTSGEFIVILDADFAPHPDFIQELMPYMADPKVGIVQSPQYYPVTKEAYKESALAYGASVAQESFYRFIQVVRDRFGAVVCCGSNALYRRSALEQIGGVSLNEHGEDLYTGFDLAERGIITRYVPVILAIGLSPDDLHAYFHQQHRWCYVNTLLMFSKKFWISPISWKAKLCYIAGLLYYLQNPLSVIFSFQIFWTLFLYNPYITLIGGLPFYPYLIWCFAGMLPGITIARARMGNLYASFTQLYSYSHVFFSRLTRNAVGWVPTNAKKTSVSRAFRQTRIFVASYIILYSVLLLMAAQANMLHFFDYNYYSVQFWIFFNFLFTAFLFWQMVRVQNRV